MILAGPFQLSTFYDFCPNIRHLSLQCAPDRDSGSQFPGPTGLVRKGQPAGGGSAAATARRAAKPRGGLSAPLPNSTKGGVPWRAQKGEIRGQSRPAGVREEQRCGSRLGGCSLNARRSCKAGPVPCSHHLVLQNRLPVTERKAAAACFYTCVFTRFYAGEI